MIRKRTRHSKSHIPEYAIWQDMRSRCYNKNNEKYRIYGARGITVCDRWNNSFEFFLNDMGSKPDGMSIDRIDNNGNYEPNNCKWSTAKEQANNTRTNHYITIDSETKTLAQWSDISGIDAPTIRYRLRSGISSRYAVFAKPGHVRGEQNGVSTLTEADVIKMRHLYVVGNYTLRELGTMFNVVHSTVYNVISRKTWGHI